MSRKGLIQTLRGLLKDYKDFGQPELQRLKRQAEILKGEVDRLKAAKERNEARERELMSSVQDYGEYIRMMSLVKTETEKKAERLAGNIIQHVAAHENAAEHDKAMSALMKAFEGDERDDVIAAKTSTGEEQSEQSGKS